MAKKNPPKTPKNTKPADDEEEDTTQGGEGSGDEDGDDDGDDNQRINAIVTSRVKRALKPLEDMVKSLAETVGKMSPTKQADQDDEDDEDDEEQEPGKKPDTAVARKLDKLNKQLKNEREARKQAENAQKEAEEKRKRDEMRTHTNAALAKHGIKDPMLAKGAISILEENGVITRDDEGKIKYKSTDKYGIESLVEVDAGISQWIKGEGKSFLPAVDAGGSGQGSANAGGAGSVTKKDLAGMNPVQKARIAIERASMGLPPLE